MKKIFTLVAVATLTLSVHAQVTWSMEDGTQTGVSANPGIEVLSSSIGAELKLDGYDTYKVGEVYYPWASTKVTPLTDQSPADETHEKAYTLDMYRKISEAVDAGMYLNFSAQTIDVEDLLAVESIEFDATRVGTDNVFVNARIIGNEGSYTSAWLINGDNAATVSGGVGTWQSKDAEGDAWMTTVDAGFKPARNKAGQADDTNEQFYTHFTIPAPTDLPEDLYEATVQIAIYGISSNKNAYLHGVKLNCSVAGESAVAGVAEAKSEAKKAVKVITANGIQIGNYNIAGQQVK